MAGDSISPETCLHASASAAALPRGLRFARWRGPAPQMSGIDTDHIASPFDRGRVERAHQDRVEAAWRLAADHGEVAARGGDEARALARRNALDGTAVT